MPLLVPNFVRRMIHLLADHDVDPELQTLANLNYPQDYQTALSALMTEAQAVAARRVGRDVVVCGNDLCANRELAKNIEHAANGSYKRCPPHAGAGPNALPHYQPNPRPPAGHTFYETTNRKAE